MVNLFKRVQTLNVQIIYLDVTSRQVWDNLVNIVSKYLSVHRSMDLKLEGVLVLIHLAWNAGGSEHAKVYSINDLVMHCIKISD
jgi:hypothetical protein